MKDIYKTLPIYAYRNLLNKKQLNHWAE